MKMWAMIGMGLIAYAWSSMSHAAVPMLECAGCTPQQEEAKIKSGSRNGWYFTYNLPNQRVRKFLTYLVYNDSPAQTSPGEKTVKSLRSSKNFGGTIINVTPATEAEVAVIGPGTNAAGWQRVLEEYPVDQVVRNIFNAIIDTEAQIPGINFNRGRANVPIEGFGLTVGPVAPRFFDPREIAWTQLNGGEYNTFIERVRDTFESEFASNQASPVVGKLIHEIRGQAKAATIGVGTDGVTAGIEIERLSDPVPIKVCDSHGNCVWLTISKSGTAVQVTYEKTVDSRDVNLPTRSRDISMEWPGYAGGSATEYANWLRDKGRATTEVIGGSSGCRGYLLACTGITDTSLLACKLYCQ